MKQILILLMLTLALFSCDTTETVEEHVLLSVGKLRCDTTYPVVSGFHRNYAEYNLTDPTINTIRVDFVYRTTQTNTLNSLGSLGINFQDSVWTWHGRDSIYLSAGYQYQVTGLSYVLQNNNGVIPIFFELLLKQGPPITKFDYCEFLDIKVVKVD